MNHEKGNSFKHFTKMYLTDPNGLKLNGEISSDPHHRECEGLLLQVLSSVTQDKRKYLHCLSKPHFIS